MEDLTRQVLKGYEIRERIGEGGFGVVYRAYQTSTEREVAIKAILPQYANQPAFIRRFETEAQTVARLEHIHITPLYDYWRDPTGAYLVMRWLRGGSVRDLLNQGPVEHQHVVKIIEQVAAALTIAHRRGIIHQDIKPGNILLDEEGNAYLADFGIARRLSDDPTTDEDEGLSASPAYASPEQIRSEGISPKVDIYGLGIVIYEMLTGMHPFHDTYGSQILLKHLTEPLPSLYDTHPELPPEIDLIIQRATAKDPSLRFDTPLELAGALRDALLGREQAQNISFAPQKHVGEDTISYRTLDFSTSLELPEFDNPYKGLYPFREADAADFFGRETLVEGILSRLRDEDDVARFLAVVGPSGSGKSSIVHAGVLPALRRNAVTGSAKWYVSDLVPGDNPMQEIGAALLSIAIDAPDGLMDLLTADHTGLHRALKQMLPEDGTLLLIIDQFEEIFTLVEDEQLRQHFLDSLMYAITAPDSQIRVIITLRADFYDRPLLYPDFGELVRARTVVVLPMTEQELERAIIGPAERVGLILEEGLAAAMMAEVRDQPGALPLLQYALTEMFERREDHRLTLRAYRESGGVAGALARRADELFIQQDENGKRAIRQLFLRLVAIGEGADDARRRIPQSELWTLGDRATMRAIIDLYGKYRLLTFDHDPVDRSPTVEVAHEALLRRWERLREWINDSREDVILQRRIAQATREWLKQNRDDSFLVSGLRLQQYEQLLLSEHVALNDDEIDLIKTSIARREQLEAEEEARKAHEALLERRARQRLRAIAFVLLIAAIVSGAFAVIAINQSQIAEENAALAARNEAEMRSVALAASAQRALADQDVELALSLALEANRGQNPPVQAQRTLADAAYALGTIARLSGHNGPVYSVAISPNGDLGASGSTDGTVRLWDLITRTEVGRIQLGTTPYALDFSPDGTRLAVGDTDNNVHIFDVETREELLTFEDHTAPVWTVDYSPDGSRIVSGAADASLYIWDANTGELLFDLVWHYGAVYSAEFSPDGQQVVSGAGDWLVVLWDANSGELIAEMDAHEDEVHDVTFSPDGRYILSASWDNTLILWDAATQRLKQRLLGHTDHVHDVAFQPDGQRAVSASEDNTLILWDIPTGQPITQLTGHSGAVRSVAYAPDGQSFISGGFDHDVRLWRVRSGAEIATYTILNNTLASAVYSPDGTLAAVAASDGRIHLWDTTSNRPIAQLEGHERTVTALAFSPDGRYLASGSTDQTIIIWDIAAQTIRHTLRGHINTISGLAFSPSGEYLLSASLDATIKQWRVESGELLGTWTQHGAQVLDIAYMPDGQQAVSSAIDGNVIIWDTSKPSPFGEVKKRFMAHNAAVFAVAISPNGQQIATGSREGELKLWDANTTEELLQLEGHLSAITDLAYHPNSQLLASASENGAITIWDINSQEAVRRYSGHNAAVRAVSFSPNGDTLLSSSDDGTARLWYYHNLDTLITWVQDNRYIRPLTCAEREQFRLEPLCE